MSESLLKSANSFAHNPSYAIAEDYDLFPMSVKPSYADEVGPAIKAVEFFLKTKAPEAEPAAGFLKEAQEAMELKAKLRDTPKGERTAEQIAKVFNAITGHELTETDAWTFLLVLKLVRSRNGKYNRDDYVDLSAYSALMGEHASTGVK